MVNWSGKHTTNEEGIWNESATAWAQKAVAAEDHCEAKEKCETRGGDRELSGGISGGLALLDGAQRLLVRRIELEDASCNIAEAQLGARAGRAEKRDSRGAPVLGLPGFSISAAF